MAAPIYKGGKPFFGSGLRQRVPVIASSGATMTITKANSGSIYLLDRATLTYTLPAPKVGLWYVFIGTIAATAQEIDTDAGTTFLMGAVAIASSGTRGDFAGNGTSHVKVQLNGTTKGGAAVGSVLYFYCLTATQWQVDGQLNGSGVAVSPFA